VDTYGGWGNNNQWDAFANAIADYNNGDEAAYIALMSQQTRLLSQIAIWKFYSEFDFEIVYYSTGARPGIPDQYKIAIDDLLANGLTGEGELMLAYLVCAEGGLDHITSCQPQFVPYFPSFDNKTKGDLYGTMSAEIEISGKRDVYRWTYKEVPNTKSASGSITADARGSTTATWFGGTLVNVAAVKEEPVKVSQLRTGNSDSGNIIPTGYEISIDEDGFVWINLLDIVTADASVQLLPINSEGKGVQNNNGGHVTRTGMFNTGLNVGDADEVFVYVHFNSLTYLDGTTSWVKDRRVFVGEKDVLYTGTLSLVVEDEAGNVVFSASGTLEDVGIDLNGVILIPGEFSPGKYFATLSGDGFEPIDLEDVLVKKGTITFDFGSIVVTYPDRVIDPGEPT